MCEHCLSYQTPAQAGFSFSHSDKHRHAKWSKIGKIAWDLACSFHHVPCFVEWKNTYVVFFKKL